MERRLPSARSLRWRLPVSQSGPRSASYKIDLWPFFERVIVEYRHNQMYEVGNRRGCFKRLALGPQSITVRCRGCASFPLLFGADICDSPMTASQSAVRTVTAVAKLSTFAKISARPIRKSTRRRNLPVSNMLNGLCTNLPRKWPPPATDNMADEREAVS